MQRVCVAYPSWSYVRRPEPMHAGQGEELVSVGAMISLGLRVSIFLCVLVLGLRASFRDATHVLRSPYLLVSSFVAMFVMMPAVAVALATSFDLHPAVKIALVALAVSPVPPFVPQKELGAGGSSEYTIGLLAASAAASIVVVPAALAFFQRMFDMPLGLSGGGLVESVSITVLVPLLAGMALRAAAPALAQRLAKPVGIVANVVLVVAALVVLASRWRALGLLVGDGTLIALIVFSVVGVIVGHALGGPARENRTVLALSTASRHPAVALVIAHATFPNEKLAAPAVMWALITNAIVTSVYVARAKRHSPGVPIEATHRVRG